MTDPVLRSNFGVDLVVGGNNMGSFTSVTGGSMSIVVIEHVIMYDDGSSRGIYIPGATNFEPITLSHGLTSDMAYWDWWSRLAAGEREVYTASIIAYNQAGSRMAQWDLEDAWVSRISGFHFVTGGANTLGNQVAIASVTLVTEDIKRVEVPPPPQLMITT